MRFSSDEKWDLYEKVHPDDPKDESFRRIGTIIRGYNIPEGNYHLAVEVIPTDRKGHVLITKRSTGKKRGAGKYEFPAGSVLAGEDPLDAAKRELFEETGLRATRYLKLQKNYIPGLIRITYVATIPNLTSEKIRLQPGETEDYRIITMDEWIDVLNSGIFENTRQKMYKTKTIPFLYQYVGVPERVEESPPNPAPDIKLDFSSSNSLLDKVDKVSSVPLSVEERDELE